MAGILSSRIFGLIREQVVLNFLGVSALGDVLQGAFKAPNILQNLLGEGTMSAAFIPIYSRMLEEGRAKDAGRFAGAIFSLLVVVVSVLVLIGMALAEPLLSVLNPGWIGDAAKVAAGEMSVDRLAVAVKAVRIIFPMAGILALSAWALGVLNSHRRFFIPYFAPVLWNLAIIVGLSVGSRIVMGVEEDGGQTLLFAAFYGALVGSGLQFAVQLPLVFREMEGFRLSLSTRVAGVMASIKAFGPAVAGRGVSQISAYLDGWLASFLAVGSFAAIRPALILYLLPISLFGLSVAAAELPELARTGIDSMKPFVERLRRSIRQSMFLTVPTTIGYLTVGFFLIAALFRRGEFGIESNFLVWFVLSAYSLGLIATTMGRLLQNSFWALGDTKTPARIAVVRLVVSITGAVPVMLLLDPLHVSDVMGVDPDNDLSSLSFGAVGLGLGSAIAAWVELWRLQTALNRKIHEKVLPWRSVFAMVGLSLCSAAVGLTLYWIIPSWPILIQTLIVLGGYAAVYLVLARLLSFSELQTWIGRIGRRR